MLCCCAMALVYEEDDGLAFLVSSLLTVIAGLLLHRSGHDAKNALGLRDAFLVVTLTWVSFSVTGMLPYLVSGYIHSVTDAFFETMSGFTTTGCTILKNVEILPHAMLFWRALTQFMGGIGIVFFTVALLPSVVGGSVRVFAAESSGPMNSKLHPRLSSNAHKILIIYVGLTVLCMLSFKFAGMQWFDAICYSLSTTATGGFSVHNEGVFSFDSDAIEFIAILFQFLSGVSFALLYSVIIGRNITALRKNSELKFYVSLVLSATVVVAAVLIDGMGYTWYHAFRAALFQVVSFTTTTGLYSENVSLWPHITWVILCFLAFSGACSGSTSGGLKCVRWVMIIKIVKNEFKKKLHPRAVLPVRVNGENMDRNNYSFLLAFIVMYVSFVFITAIIMMCVGLDGDNAMAVSLSCVSNIGPVLGSLGQPDMSWAALPLGIKWMCSFLMLVGRLEIFTVLVIFTPSFWKDN